jgi:hypothetical protein
MLTGMGRRLTVDQLLGYAVEQGWLIRNGRRVSPGEVEPEPDSSLRYTPAPLDLPGSRPTLEQPQRPASNAAEMARELTRYPGAGQQPLNPITLVHRPLSS